MDKILVKDDIILHCCLCDRPKQSIDIMHIDSPGNISLDLYVRKVISMLWHRDNFPVYKIKYTGGTVVQ